MKHSRLVKHLFGVLAVVLAAIVILGFVLHAVYTVAYPKKYTEYVEKYAEEYHVDQNLVYAVIRCESGFNPNAVSNVGAKGLMQLMEDTFDWAQSRMPDAPDVTYDQVFDPEVNIQHGVYVLHLLLEEFQSEPTAIAAYHAGWGSVKEWLESPEHSPTELNIESIPFDDTKTYVKRVLKTKFIYEKIYKE
ncbi:lytic transglycosylase domain-containing protein [Clostridium facile]|uniref:Lytic transglycosylase domain-containing protein n=1 Tax=Clostridium facile TaxID=2763035 RepID=A0ABR7IRP3_9CLOT|nr:lytic transglycosylase domain-containing protein [Clostridium facile]MBC5787819.1 lytic transglycosylase domain-containing protein [Clostridium facile]